MRVTYRKLIPHPPERVLSQYFDLEHLPFVHPRTFGVPRLLSCKDMVVVWEVRLRILGLHLRTRIEEEYRAPDEIHSRVTGGLLRGTSVATVIRPHSGGAVVEETYTMPFPAIPPLSWIARLWLEQWLDRLWAEDLSVGLPHGGRPGVPGTPGFGA